MSKIYICGTLKFKCTKKKQVEYQILRTLYVSGRHNHLKVTKIVVYYNDKCNKRNVPGL